MTQVKAVLPDERGWFGAFGGQFVPETLMYPLEQLIKAYAAAQHDTSFLKELNDLLSHYTGRPTPLYYARRLTEQWGGAKIYLKREDLAHTGAHKINNVLGQGLLTKRMGKPRIIAETGAGQHGVATATAAALLDLECEVYMGAVDVERQALNVFRMQLLGAKVTPVSSGSRTLKDAINEAIRDWVTNVDNTHYCIGSVVGPHPYPMIVRDFQRIIGDETKQQILKAEGRLPDHVLACVGGGSNSMGIFFPFVEDEAVQLIGVEAGGHGLETNEHSATLMTGSPGVLHGAMSLLMQDEHGQIADTHSISAGLDYPSVGPEHSWLKDSGRASYTAVGDDEALAAFKLLAQSEGILPALEPAHAIAHAAKLAPTLPRDAIVVICLSGRGDKDVEGVAKALEDAKEIP